MFDSSAIPTLLAEALSADAGGMLAISAAILVLFASGELVSRTYTIPTEYTRKFSHVGAGLIVMTFPWLLSQTVSVAILSCAFFGVLIGGKLTGLLGSVHNVQRRTSGAYFYPWAVLGSFWLAQGDPLLFCAPIAVMALADTGAALAGKRVGQNTYQVMDGVRSIEGSLTFFALALCIMIVALGLARQPGWPEMLLVALVVAALSTATEAISVRGVDNLFIPYACFLVLDRTLRLGLRDLSGWIEGMLISLLVVLASVRWSGLTISGAVTVFLGGTLSWALGGWAWTLPLLAFYILAVSTLRIDRVHPMDMDEIFPSIVGSLVVILAFAHSAQAELFGPYVATLGANAAIVMMRSARVRSWPVLPMILAGALVPLFPVQITHPEFPILTLFTGVAAGVASYALLDKVAFSGRRLVASLMAGAIAWTLLPPTIG
jgi:dolichol kinase